MALIIFPRGRPRPTATGKLKRRHSDECPNGTPHQCEPYDRELARIISRQWVKTRDVVPPKAIPLLYLEYPSADPFGTVRQGHYDRQRQKFIKQESGEAIAKELVIAWMPIPKIPVEIFQNHGPLRL